MPGHRCVSHSELWCYGRIQSNNSCFHLFVVLFLFQPHGSLHLALDLRVCLPALINHLKSALFSSSFRNFRSFSKQGSIRGSIPNYNSKFHKTSKHKLPKKVLFAAILNLELTLYMYSFGRSDSTRTYKSWTFKLSTEDADTHTLQVRTTVLQLSRVQFLWVTPSLVVKVNQLTLPSLLISSLNNRACKLHASHCLWFLISLIIPARSFAILPSLKALFSIVDLNKDLVSYVAQEFTVWGNNSLAPTQLLCNNCVQQFNNLTI